MPNYKLVITTEADQELARLYEEGFIKWGESRTDEYYEALLNHFDTLCDNPFMFRAVDEVRKGYRRGVCGKHSVYYRIVDKTVEIMTLVKYENRP